MLEQLSNTIDTAHSVIAEQQALTPDVLLGEEAGISEETTVSEKEQNPGQDSGSEIPLQPPAETSGRRVFVPALATAISLFFSISALAAMWLFWNSPETSGKIELGKDQGRIPDTIVSRTNRADLVPRAPDSTPARAVPLQSPASPPPGPVKISEPEIKTEPPVKAVTPIEPAIEAVKDEPEPPAKTVAAIAPVEPGIEAVKDAPKNAAIAVEKAPALPALGKEEEKQLMERGRELISSGDVASARLAFEYAALRGSADAMYALAQTYDMDVLTTWNVYGIEPDVKIALKWYGRAAQNGHDPADARASELEKLTKRQP